MVTRKLAQIVLACLLAAASASAQSLIKIGEFTSRKADVQFLPGGMVIIHDNTRNSQPKTYRYRSGKFVVTKSALSPSITKWRSFAWEGVDSLNQLDLNYWVEPSMAGFVPSYSKIKAYATIPGLYAGKTLVILCYAAVPDEVPEKDRATLRGPRNLHLLLMSRKPGPTYTDTIYTKLADVLVTKEAAFGTLLVEPQPAEIFVAVYFASGDSDPTSSIAVYKLRPTPRHRDKRK